MEHDNDPSMAHINTDQLLRQLQTLEARVTLISTRLFAIESNFNAALRLQIKTSLHLASLLESTRKNGQVELDVEEFSELTSTIRKLLDRYKVALHITEDAPNGQ